MKLQETSTTSFTVRDNINVLQRNLDLCISKGQKWRYFCISCSSLIFLNENELFPNEKLNIEITRRLEAFKKNFRKILCWTLLEEKLDYKPVFTLKTKRWLVFGRRQKRMLVSFQTNINMLNSSRHYSCAWKSIFWTAPYEKQLHKRIRYWKRFASCNRFGRFSCWNNSYAPLPCWSVYNSQRFFRYEVNRTKCSFAAENPR